MSPIIDARGKACPTPVIMAKKAISAGESTFTVLVDNTTAVENLKRLAANQGFDAAVTEQGGAFHLARMFFYTLSQGEDKPGAVLFMNAGVKLPTLDEQVAEHLKVLSAAGVEILVCGTCLNFYGLTDRLRVGTVSNMYDIVTRMQKAGKVISL